MVEPRSVSEGSTSVAPIASWHSASARHVENVANPVDHMTPAELKAALHDVPKGTFAVAGLAVASLALAWLLTFFFIFLPRGPIG